MKERIGVALMRFGNWFYIKGLPWGYHEVSRRDRLHDTDLFNEDDQPITTEYENDPQYPTQAGMEAFAKRLKELGWPK